MPTHDQFETIIFSQRKAFKAWKGEAVLKGHSHSEEASELVWELLISYGESIDDLDDVREDIYKAAYELATLELPTLQISKLLEVYRDCLLNSMIDALGKTARDQYLSLITFTNLLSSAYCEAHSDQLKRTIRHNRAESLSSELKLAKQIQRHLLPKSIPDIPGFEFAGRLVPATELGGDYWSVKYYKEDDVVTLKLADISGHGVAAATLVAAVKFISGGYYRGSESAAEVMYQTNRVLTKETPYDILVTMAYAWLRPSVYELSVVNAGHEPVFLCHDAACVDVKPTGPVLGVAEIVQYQERVFKLDKGDIIFFASDGITEAGVREPFGMQRLKNIVVSNSSLSADEIADRVIASVMEYEPQPHDDISLLVVKVTGEPPAGH